MMDDKKYAVYLINRIKPVIVSGKNSENVSRRWQAHYGETPIKVVQVKFDPDTGEYKPV